MCRQNRVTPDGTIISDPTRGLFMGNRGILHDDTGHLTHRRWRHRNWIICQTSFKGRRRALMSPGRYTELFFLDEATALAAGHRPCCECRRDAYVRFFDALKKRIGQACPVGAQQLDERLHRERAVPRRFLQRTWTTEPGGLPDGTMIRRAENSSILILWRGGVAEWSPDGYGRLTEFGKNRTGVKVEVLTPPTTVNALASGYVPVVHPSLCNQR